MVVLSPQLKELTHSDSEERGGGRVFFSVIINDQPSHQQRLVMEIKVC